MYVAGALFTQLLLLSELGQHFAHWVIFVNEKKKIIKEKKFVKGF
jgi:hypothetical protein